jgi:Tfp pilus assembly protein PilN
MAGAAFNFARRPFRDYRPVYLAAMGMLAVGLVLFAVNATLYGEFRRDVADTRDEIAWLEKRQATANAAAEDAREALRAYELSQLAGESRGLRRLVEERQFSWMTLLGRLERVLPPEVRLSRLSPKFEDSGETVIDIALIGRGPETVVRTIAAFSKSPYFATVELKSETRPDATEGVPEGYTFSITTVYHAEGMP